jgi:proton glutamate symport protein
MKFSRSALLAGLLILLAAALTFWAGQHTSGLVGATATQEPINDQTGLGIHTLATAARWLALGALAFFVAPRRSLTGWIVLSMLVGIELGHDAPAVALNLKVLSDAFLRLVKTIIAPLVFATLVVGIAGHANLKQVGRMGLKALVYFEVVTTFALLIGLAAINLTKAGVGIKHTAIVEKADALAPAAKQTAADIILHIFPENIAKSVAEGQVLQVVVFAIIFAIGLALTPEHPRRVMLAFCESLSEVMFKFTNVVMYFAPLGVGGAMAYTVAKLGFGPLLNAFQLLLTLYGALIGFVLLVLLPVALLMRIPLRRFVAAVAEPVSIAFATTSSEAALPAPHRGFRDANGLLLQPRRHYALLVVGGGICGTGRRRASLVWRPGAARVHAHAHKQGRGGGAARLARDTASHPTVVQFTLVASVHHFGNRCAYGHGSHCSECARQLPGVGRGGALGGRVYR